ncbi:MAG: DUF2490 domain-containing protein [Candidatus Solibacter usitatus]|nr:DUF2490 domain-containing protein [Candidatus Solibacter usitatus]
MKQLILAGALAALLAPNRLAAEDVESLHAFHVNLDFKPGWTLQLHARVRTFEDIGAFNQFRVGPILIWQAKPRFTVLAGYYFTNQHARALHTSSTVQRLWSGGQYRVARGETWSVDARGMLERFIPAGLPEYWRWRNRAMLNKTTRIGELYVSGEGLVHRGVWFGQYTSGLKWKVNPRVTLGAGYEYRQTMSGPASHVIGTYFQWSAYHHVPPHTN